MALSPKLLEALKAQEQPLSEVKPTFKALLYGSIGTGKTYMAMHLAHMLTPPDKDIVYVDYAEGWTAIKDNEEIVNHSRRFRYSSINQLLALAEAIVTKADGFENVGSIVLDEYSSMVDNNLEEIVKTLHKEDASKYDEYEAAWPHYSRNKAMCTRVHRALNRIPGVNIVYIAHAKERVEEASGLSYLEPNFNPSYGKDFLQDLQLVGHMTADVRKDNYTRKIQVQPERRVAAKNRLGFSKSFISSEELVDGVRNFIGGEKVSEPELDTLVG